MTKAFRTIAETLPQDVWNRLSDCLERFEEACGAGITADWREFLPDDTGEHTAAFVAELIKVDWERRWRRGERRLTEDYLAECPGGVVDDRLALELLHNECLLRCQVGECVDEPSLTRRFPELTNGDAFTSMLASIKQHDSEAVNGSSCPDGRISVATSIDAPDGKSFGRYILTDVLGRGAMGIVFRAYDRKLGRTVALKTPVNGGLYPDGDLSHQSLVSDRDGNQFLREAQALAAVSHPNICTVFECGRHEGIPYLTMELIEGIPLDDWLERQTSIDPWQAAELTRQLSDALVALESAGLVHRDVKSANVVLVDGLKPVLTDFGVADNLRRATDEWRRSHWAGTPAFMAPEQARGEPADTRSDIYSLGVVFYHLVTARLPFTGTLDFVLESIRSTVPTPLSTVRADVDDGLITWCEKAMAHDASDRFQTASETATVLRRLIAGRKRRRTRNRWMMGFTALVALIVAGFLVGRMIDRGASGRKDGSNTTETRLDEELQSVIAKVRGGGLPDDPGAKDNVEVRMNLLKAIKARFGRAGSEEAIGVLNSMPWPRPDRPGIDDHVWWNRKRVPEGVPFRVRPKRALIVSGEIPPGREADRFECWVDARDQPVTIECWAVGGSQGFTPRVRIRGRRVSSDRFDDEVGTKPGGAQHFVLTGRFPANDRWLRLNVMRDGDDARDSAVKYFFMLQVQSHPDHVPIAATGEVRVAKIRAAVESGRVEFSKRRLSDWREELLDALRSNRPAPEVQRAAVLLSSKLWAERDDAHGVHCRRLAKRRKRTTFRVAPDRPLLVWERLSVEHAVNSLRVVTDHDAPISVRLVSLTPNFVPMVLMRWPNSTGDRSREQSNTSAAPFLHPSLDVVSIEPAERSRSVFLRISAEESNSRGDILAGRERSRNGEYLLFVWQQRRKGGARDKVEGMKMK